MEYVKQHEEEEKQKIIDQQNDILDELAVERETENHREEVLEHQGQGAQYLDELVWGVEDDLMSTQKDIENDFYGIENDFSHAYNYDKWSKETWSQRSVDFAWFFRFIFTGAPWAVIALFFNTVNLLINVVLNKLWGGMNVILLWNSFVSLTQGLASFLLVSQVPTYMAHMQAMRRFSFALAVMYNFFWLWAVVEFIVDKRKARKEHRAYVDGEWSFL